MVNTIGFRRTKKARFGVVHMRQPPSLPSRRHLSGTRTEGRCMDCPGWGRRSTWSLMGRNGVVAVTCGTTWLLLSFGRSRSSRSVVPREGRNDKHTRAFHGLRSCSLDPHTFWDPYLCPVDLSNFQTTASVVRGAVFVGFRV